MQGVKQSGLFVLFLPSAQTSKAQATTGEPCPGRLCAAVSCRLCKRVHSQFSAHVKKVDFFFSGVIFLLKSRRKKMPPCICLGLQRRGKERGSVSFLSADGRRLST